MTRRPRFLIGPQRGRTRATAGDVDRRPTDEPARTPAGGRLADLARAGHLGLPQPSMQVEFEIHHVVDGPGRLVGILDRATESFAETLSAGGNGVGVVVGTRIAEFPAPAPAGQASGPSPVHLEPGATRATFHGSARPNPTFQHGPADRFEAVICIEDEPRRVLLRHGLGLRDLVAEVARISVQEQAPLLSLQCPAQIPPQTSRRGTGATPTRAVESSRSSSLALRFSMAPARPRAAVRMRIAERLAAYCRAKGLGLWLADTRAGYHTGDWFIVARHERSRARRGYDPDGHVRGGAAEGCLPVTLVGPARLGATDAVAAFLARFPTVGVLACSMTPLDELAFVHLQLAVDGASRGRLTGINRALAGWSGAGASPVDVLPRVMAELLGVPAPADGEPDSRRLLAAAEDYQVVVGPALPVVVDSATARMPVWFSWQISASRPGLRVPVRTLTEAVDMIGLGASDAGPAPSIEYLVCRQVGPSRLRGKGKLAVPKQLVEENFSGHHDHQRISPAVPGPGAGLARAAGRRSGRGRRHVHLGVLAGVLAGPLDLTHDLAGAAPRQFFGGSAADHSGKDHRMGARNRAEHTSTFPHRLSPSTRQPSTAKIDEPELTAAQHTHVRSRTTITLPNPKNVGVLHQRSPVERNVAQSERPDRHAAHAGATPGPSDLIGAGTPRSMPARRTVPQRDGEPAGPVDQAGAAQHTVLDELGEQPQVEQVGVPADAAHEVGDRQLDLRDAFQAGDHAACPGAMAATPRSGGRRAVMTSRPGRGPPRVRSSRRSGRRGGARASTRRRRADRRA